MRIGRGLRLIAAIAALSLIPAPAAVASGTTVPVEITDPSYIGKVGLDQGVCYEWMLYGVRGSGEPALQGAGIGATLKVAHNELSRMMKFRGKLGSAFPTDYLALPVSLELSPELAKEWWFQQVLNNVHVNVGLRALALACPNSKILLAGYSQGAIAISSAYQALAKGPSDPILAKVRGAFLVANPARNSNRALLRQLNGYCKRGNALVTLTYWSIVSEACRSQVELEYDNLATRTPRSKTAFKVREFQNTNDIFADFQIARNFIAFPRAAGAAAVKRRFDLAEAAHKNYTSENRGYVNALRRFSSEVR